LRMGNTPMLGWGIPTKKSWCNILSDFTKTLLPLLNYG
jgi:hypothetical protein